MRPLASLWRRSSTRVGIVALSFMQDGLAIAIADSKNNHQLKLVHSEFLSNQDPEQQKEYLKEWLTQYKLADYTCHMVLAANDYRRINLEAPAVNDTEMKEAIRWKINDLIDFPIDNAIIDYYEVPTSLRASNIKMLEVVVSPHDTVNQHIKQCRDAGFDLKVIDIQETSLRNLAVLLSENKQGVAVLHLLEFSGTLVVQKEGVIYLARTFEFGYHKLNLDDPFEQDAQSAIEQNNLILEIQRSLDYVESYYGMPPISILAVIPCARHTLDLLNILNNNPSIMARVMDLSTIVECDKTLDDPLQSRCAPVIGATLRYIAGQL